MDELTKAELARIRDEDQRQNRRIELLEDMSKVIQDLVLSIHGLAKDMEQMLQEQKEQDNQSKRLDALEREPGNTYKDIKKTVITAIVSALAGSLATGLILILSQTIH